MVFTFFFYLPDCQEKPEVSLKTEVTQENTYLSPDPVRKTTFFPDDVKMTTPRVPPSLRFETSTGLFGLWLLKARRSPKAQLDQWRSCSS